MVKGKRGQIFSLMIVFYALFLCIIVISLYYIQQGNTDASLVSPREVLDLRTELDIFELREFELINSSLVGATGNFGDDDFRDSFRDNFIDGVLGDKKMEEFLFEDLFVDGIDMKGQNDKRNLIENRIYPESLAISDGDDFYFGRAKIEKRTLLIAKDESRINFPVFFNFEFDRKYLIINNSGKFEVTRV